VHERYADIEYTRLQIIIYAGMLNINARFKGIHNMLNKVGLWSSDTASRREGENYLNILLYTSYMTYLYQISIISLNLVCLMQGGKII